MKELQFSFILYILHLSFCYSSNLNCSVWVRDMSNLFNCCKIPIPMDEKIISSPPEGNLTYCEKQEILDERLNFKNADKTVFKNYLTKVITDSDWQPIFIKNIDQCMDLTPKLVPTYAMNNNLTEDGCGVKTLLSMSCWMASAFTECPAKFFTDSAECKDLKNIVSECLKDPAEIIKGFGPKH